MIAALPVGGAQVQTGSSPAQAGGAKAPTGTFQDALSAAQGKAAVRAKQAQEKHVVPVLGLGQQQAPLLDILRGMGAGTAQSASLAPALAAAASTHPKPAGPAPVAVTSPHGTVAEQPGTAAAKPVALAAKPVALAAKLVALAAKPVALAAKPPETPAVTAQTAATTAQTAAGPVGAAVEKTALQTAAAPSAGSWRLQVPAPATQVVKTLDPAAAASGASRPALPAAAPVAAAKAAVAAGVTAQSAAPALQSPLSRPAVQQAPVSAPQAPSNGKEPAPAAQASRALVQAALAVKGARATQTANAAIGRAGMSTVRGETHRITAQRSQDVLAAAGAGEAQAGRATPGLSREVSVQIAQAAQAEAPHVQQGGASMVRIALNPPQLGHVNVTLRAGADGLLAILRAEEPAAAAVLQMSQGELRQRLESLGLGKAHVEVMTQDRRQTVRPARRTSAGGGN